MKVVIASGNRGKIEEIKDIVSLSSIEWLTLEDFADWPEIEERGTSYEENALSKAKRISAWSGMAALADDSGLEVDYLDGGPGVFSARYGGEQGNDVRNRQKLLQELEGVTEQARRAKFVCVAAMVVPGEEPLVTRGECTGHVTTSPRGDLGFGYDPLFVPDGHNRTMAELDPAEKNRISHRGRAFREMGRVMARMAGETQD